MTSVFLPSYTIGAGCYSEFSRVTAALGQSFLLIGGEKALAEGGEKLLGALSCGQKPVGIELFGRDCTAREAERLASLYRGLEVDFVVGMGGGKALDTAKCTAHLLGAPVVTLPTIAATCAGVTALSVVYDENGAFDRFWFYERPPAHCFIATDIIAAAPEKYLRAGIGDALAKRYESTFSARGDRLGHSSLLGVNTARLCGAPLFEHAPAVFEHGLAGSPEDELEQVILACIVSTGLVSVLVDDCYNCAVAHSLYYALAELPGFEQRSLHGEAVAYGVMVQLALDGDNAELARVLKLLRLLKIPSSLTEYGLSISRDALSPTLLKTLSGPDMEHLPYPITAEMLYQGILITEKLAASSPSEL